MSVPSKEWPALTMAVVPYFKSSTKQQDRPTRLACCRDALPSLTSGLCVGITYLAAYIQHITLFHVQVFWLHQSHHVGRNPDEDRSPNLRDSPLRRLVLSRGMAHPS